MRGQSPSPFGVSPRDSSAPTPWGQTPEYQPAPNDGGQSPLGLFQPQGDSPQVSWATWGQPPTVDPVGPFNLQGVSPRDPQGVSTTLANPVGVSPRDGTDAEIEKIAQQLAAIEMQLKTQNTEKASQDKADSKKTGDSASKKTDPKSPSDPCDRFEEKWTVKLGGHVQMDYVNWAKAAPSIPNTQDYFEFRRLRLVADGTGYGVYDFRLQTTLEPETVGETTPLGSVMSPDVKDAYFSVNEIPGLGRFRIGNFFVPFSLEQVTNDTNNIFLERSIPSQGVFSPDREVGVAVYNASESKNVTWSYGVFLDSISEGLKERIDDNQGYRVSGRITWLPYYDEASNGRYLLHTGAGILHTDDQDNRVRFRARPQIHEGPRLIDSGVILADKYTTGNLEGAIVNGPFTLQSEAYLSQVDSFVLGAQNIHGCYVHASYFVTGENRVFERFGQHGAQFGRNVPRTNFFRTCEARGPGAFELKSRWSYLDLNNLNAGQYNDMTFGCNWYWSDRTRIMLDWIHPITDARTIVGATESDLLAMRFDFNW